jgi:hypothetical protein
MRPSRPTDISSRSTADLDERELPDWERRALERRTQDRFRKWTADNALALLGAAVTGLVSLTVLLGLRVEGAPQDLARSRVQAAIDQSAMAGRVGKVEDVAQLLDDNRDLKGAVKEQRYLLCYIIRKQDPAAVGAIESCNGVKAP